MSGQNLLSEVQLQYGIIALVHLQNWNWKK